MIYLLSGRNSYQALRKIKEFKAAFFKKHGNLPVEEFDGESSGIAVSDFRSALGQGSLFSAARLVIFRNILGADEKIFKTLQENGDFLKNSRDIFVFWEKDLTKHKEVSAFFKKYAEKIQEVKILDPKKLDAWLSKKAQSLEIKLSKDEREVMIEEAGENVEWALEGMLEKMSLGGETALSSKPGFESAKKPGFFPSAASPFAFIEKMFGSKALLALKEMSLSGIEPQQFIYPLLWKIKQKRMADAYLRGILAESAMRRDPKNAEEILERFIFSLPDRQARLKV